MFVNRDDVTTLFLEEVGVLNCDCVFIANVHSQRAVCGRDNDLICALVCNERTFDYRCALDADNVVVYAEFLQGVFTFVRSDFVAEKRACALCNYFNSIDVARHVLNIV